MIARTDMTRTDFHGIGSVGFSRSSPGRAMQFSGARPVWQAHSRDSVRDNHTSFFFQNKLNEGASAAGSSAPLLFGLP